MARGVIDLRSLKEESMSSLRSWRVLLMIALLFTLVASPHARAQGDNSSQAADKARTDSATGLEVQLHLLVGSRSPIGDEEKPPASLDAVIKQLRSTFTFKSYRLAATLLNRVKNGGKLSLRWAGGPLLPQASAATNSTPGINEFNVQRVNLIK